MRFLTEIFTHIPTTRESAYEHLSILAAMLRRRRSTAGAHDAIGGIALMHRFAGVGFNAAIRSGSRGDPATELERVTATPGTRALCCNPDFVHRLGG